MASMDSSRWLILYVVYVLGLSIIAFLYISAELGELETSNGFDLEDARLIELNGGVCDYYSIKGLISVYPTRYNIDSNDFGIRDINCYNLPITDNATCSLIEGCEWTDTVKWLFFFNAEVPEYCGGYINVSYYNSSYTSVGSIASDGICKMNNTLLSEDGGLCSALGCNYISDPEQKIGFNYIWETISFLFGFNATIPELPTTANIIFSILFVFLPTLAVILALFRHIPFIN